MKKSFDEVFVDNTKYCTKIKTSDYFEQGEYAIIDQGQNQIAGYTSLQDGAFNDVPAIIFGDHTRIIKYIEEPFFIGADGVKVLKSKLPNSNYKYLYYALKNADIPNTGYNRHFKWLKEVRINYPTSEKQNEVVEILDRIISVINYRKQQLQKLDELVKARFVELFGDIGIDEKCWGFEKLSNCCQINPKKSQDTRLESGLMVSFVPMPAVSEKGEIDVSETRSYDEVKSGFTYFCENDVLFAKITPCMENGKGSVARGLCNGIGFGSTEFHVLRPINGVSNPYWLYAVTAFKQFRLDAESNMTGSAGQKRVPASFLETYRVPLPPIDLQNEFADFVKQIDKSKAVVQKALDEAQTLFDSLMQEYFG